MYLYSTKIEYFKYEINIKDIVMGITKINTNIYLYLINNNFFI